MNILLIFTGLTITTLAGFSLINFLKPGLPFAEKVATGYGMGFAIATLLLFNLSLAGIPITNTVALTCLSALGIAFLLLALKRQPEHRGLHDSATPQDPQILRWAAVRIILTIMILILSVYVFVNNSYWPISSYDAMQYYDNLSNLLFSRKIALPLPNMVGTFSRLLRRYPLHLPLMHYWLYMLAGTSAINAKLLHSLYYLSLLITFHYRLRRHVGKNMALLGVFALASEPSVICTVPWAETSFIFLYYLFLGICYLCDAVDSEDKRLFILGALLVSFTLWVRPASELIFLGATLVISAATFMKWGSFTPLTLAAAGTAVYAPFNIYALHALRGGATWDEGALRWESFLQIGYVFYVFRRVILRFGFMSPGNFGITWATFSVLVFIGLLTRKAHWLLLWFIAALLAAYCLTFYLVGAYYDFAGTWRHGMLDINGSAARWGIFFQPLMIYYITLAAGKMACPRKLTRG